MSKILIIAEHDGSVINPSTAKTIACAAEIDGGEIVVAVFASSAASIARARCGETRRSCAGC